MCFSVVRIWGHMFYVNVRRRVECIHALVSDFVVGSSRRAREGLRVFVEVLVLAERRASPASFDAPYSGVV